MWVYFGLIGKFYTIIVAMQMNILEIIYIKNSGFWLRKREMIWDNNKKIDKKILLWWNVVQNK